ncbi:MAG: YfhO family protein [bacterium]|nr:YfhO family protein [bacterium]
MQNSKLQEIKTFVYRSLPVLLILVVWFVFAYPFFLQAKVPFPSTYQVNHFHPWSLDQKYWGPVKNGAMPDIIDQIYPWRHFSIEQLTKGQIPWWNPNSFSGNPHVANVQSAAFNPFNVLFFVMPFIDAWSLIVLLQPLVAGMGMYVFLRSQNITKQGAFLGSIAWMFCGFIVVWMAYGTLSLAISFLPLTLFGLYKLSETKRIKWGILSSVLIATSFFSGHFQTSLYLAGTTILYITFLGFRKETRTKALLIGAFLLGILISLIQILPAIQFYTLSPRSSIYLFSGGIPVHYLITLIAPDFYGNPVTRNDWFGFYAEWASFIGVIPLLFAFFTLRRKPRRVVIFFQLLFLFSFLFALDSPLLRLLGSLHIPVISTSTPSRLIVITSFALATLSGFGYDAVLEMIRKVKLRSVLPQLILFFVVIASIWGVILFGGILTSEQAAIAKKNFLLPTSLFFLTGVTLLLVFLLKKKQKFFIVLLLFPLFLMVFDSLRFVTKWMPFDPKNLVFPDAPVIAAMQQKIGHGRVFGNISAQVGTYFNLPLIEGYDPLYIDRYGEFIRTSSRGVYTPSERSLVRIDRNGDYTKRILDLLGVTLIYHPLPDTNQAWAFPVWNDPNYILFYKDDLFSLYSNTRVINRPSLYYRYQVIPDEKKLLATFFTVKFDYRNTLLLEADPKIPVSEGEHTSSVLVVKDTPNFLKFAVSSDMPALLFLSDNYYPGWKAYVNDKETTIFRADYTFRAVVVPAGESSVKFIYRGLF